MRMFFIALPAMLAAATAGAQTAKFADPGKSAALPASGVSSMGQVTVALVIVLAALFAAAWAMRQFRLFNRPGHGALQVLQGVNLGAKERAVLIRINDRRLLLGVTPGCVNLLLELPADSSDDVQQAAGEQRPPIDPDTPSFKALLKRSMGLK